jgi:DNA-directed RNA polymerase specialized sigma24 family protein
MPEPNDDNSDRSLDSSDRSGDELPADGLFPATRRDWLATQSASGDQGLRSANVFVMEIYRPALEAYLRGSSFRALGEGPDLVAGFFASRLGRSDFYAKWLASGVPFRRWLVNGFLYFLLEESRAKRRRAGLELDNEDETPASEPDAVDRFESTWAREVMRRACERAGEVCAAAGLGTHWEIFLRHHGDGHSYDALAQELDVPETRAPGMARTAAGILRRSLLEALMRDGTLPRDLDLEVNRLLAAMSRRA